MSHLKRPIVLTPGDPAGVGPEIIAKAFEECPQITQDCFVIGHPQVMRRAALRAGFSVDMPVVVIDDPQQALALPPRCIAVLQTTEIDIDSQMGVVSAAAGAYAASAVEWAAQAALSGAVSAIVTAPMHKEALAAAGEPYCRFPGHTEMLQAIAARSLGVSPSELPVRMMLANRELRTILVSIHVPLSEAIDAVRQDEILETLRIAHKAVGGLLQRRPRIAVAGLNPHAGEGGRFGREEIEQIIPAVAAAREIGVDAIGPISPDTVFMRARTASGKRGEFDVVIAMYHDQGLIPVKYLGVDEGVNVTLGLPFVRTSPDHGTAFDIAGRGVAKPDSLIEAIRMARDFVGLRGVPTN